MEPPAVSPPTAQRRPVTTEHHGRTRVDDYEWLRAKGSPEVTAYLEAENAYTQERTAHLADLRQGIFDEIKARTRETDLSVPTRNRGYWYYGRSFAGKEYGASCRVPVAGPDDWTPPQPAEDCAPDQPALPGEELLLDLDALAEGHEFFSLGGSSVSPDGTLLAYSTDTTGAERFTLRFLDLTTHQLLADVIEDTAYGVAWCWLKGGRSKPLIWAWKANRQFLRRWLHWKITSTAPNARRCAMCSTGTVTT